jgi:DNA (cytosine-5)-methyltransferase 1
VGEHFGYGSALDFRAQQHIEVINAFRLRRPSSFMTITGLDGGPRPVRGPSDEELPWGLDLFCGAGGCSEGYWERGFRMVGVDNDLTMLKGYRHPWVQMDALEMLRQLLDGYTIFFTPCTWKGRKRIMGETVPLRLQDFAFIHASPPCQAFSDLAKRNAHVTYPDLLTPLRPLLQQTGLPYVIENVDSAPMEEPTLLCGTMFPTLRVLRHRLFESNFIIPQRPHGKHPLVFTYDKRKPHFGKLDQDTAFVQVTGGGNCTIANARAAMGIGWMNKRQINEAIPPAYTSYIARFVPGVPGNIQRWRRTVSGM